MSRGFKGSYFSVGDIILFSKYKNKKGLIVGFGVNERGEPTVEIEPIPKGRKQNKVFGLFKLWHADETKRMMARVAARTAERLGVPPEGMMAFGDTFNDAEMLKAAKYGFLVENGSPALREEVPFLAPPNTSSGVMQVLRRVLAQNGRVCESDFRRAK